MNVYQQEIYKTIDTLTDKKLAQLGYDKTKRGKVISVDSTTCIVEIDGDNYTCKIRKGIYVQPNDIVFIKFPQNNNVDKYVDATLGNNEIPEYLVISAEEILAKLKTVDGEGSGLDADMLDGKHGSEFATKEDIEGISIDGDTIVQNINTSTSIIDDKNLSANVNDSISKKHDHSNKSILDTITQALIDGWNNAVAHISDKIKHITSSERALWNTVSNKSDKGHTHIESDITNLDKYTKAETDTRLGTKADKTYVDNELANKVDKITGKGLSTEDYTTAEKTKLSNIEDGAEKNKVNSVNSKTGDVVINKIDMNLGNVENKSSATIRNEITNTNVTNALGYTPENSSNKGVANGYAPLDSNIKIPLSMLPDIAKQQTYVVATVGDRDILSGLIMGEKCYITGTGDSYIWDGTKWQILAKADWENVNLQWTNIVGKPQSNIADIDDATVKRHMHSNKSIIDAITQTLIDRWNSAWNHISDAIRHITSAERTKWNTVDNKADTNYVNTELNKKVDKVTGKQLSTEDFTTTEKDKLTDIENGANKYILPNATTTRLGGIKVGANLSVADDGTIHANDNPASFIVKQEVFVATEGQTVFNLTQGNYKPNTNTLSVYLYGGKQPNISITETSSTSFKINSPLKAGVVLIAEYFEIINIHPYPHHSSEHLTGGYDPIPKVTNLQDGLMTKEDKGKLNNIEAGANKYIHPTSHPASMITESTSRRFVSDVEKANWNTVDNKSNIGHKHTEADITNLDKYTKSETDAKLSLKQNNLSYTPIKDGGDVPEFKSGLESEKPGATGSGLVYLSIDTQKIWKDTAVGRWTQMGGQDLSIATKTTLGGIKVGANLSITADGTLSAVDDDSKSTFIVKQELFTATEGQTIFNLTKGYYQPNTNTISVYLYGGKQPNIALNEISSSSFEITEPLKAGDVILVEYIELSSATPYPIHGNDHITGGYDPIPKATVSSDGLMAKEDKAKLNGIATGATKNDTDANLKNRANHTGTQSSSTISDFASTVRNTVLTGLSTATNAVITTTDTVLSALGKLQKQISNNLSALDNKEDKLGYIPVNKSGDTMNGDLKVNGEIMAGTELVVGYNGTTDSLKRHKFKYNGSTGYLELWRYSRQNKWELSATFPNRNTGSGGLTVEGKAVAFADDVNTALANKVDKITGKGLSTEDYTTAEKNKLSGISTGAEVNQNAFSNIKIGTSTISADNKMDTIELIAGTGITLTPDAVNDKLTISGVNQYEHPETHPADMIVESSTKQFVSDSEKSIWNTIINKSDKTYVDNELANKVDKITGKGLSTEDYTTAEKTKLSNIEDGAEKNKVNSVNSKTGDVVINKIDMNLGNVENKSSATIRNEITNTNVTNALGYTPENSSNKGVANGYAPLDSNVKIPLSMLPDIAKQQTYVVETITDRDNLTGLIMGEKCYVTTLGDSYIWDGIQWQILAKADWENVNLQWTNIVGKPQSNVADIDDATSKRHTHSNKSIIDTITQTLVDRWNSAWNHISDAIRHITSAERTKWNTVDNKADTTYVDTELNKKVDKVTGKQLSTEDYTTAEKAKLTNIEDGANKYILPNATATALGGIKVGANLSITEDGILNAIDDDSKSTFIIKQELFVATEGQTLFNLTKGHYQPNTNTISVYLYGGKQPNIALNEISSSSFEITEPLKAGDVVLVEYIELSSATPYPIHGSDHLTGGYDPIPKATVSSDGLMAKEDKGKLDGIEGGANKYTHPSNHPYSILTGVPTKLSDFSKDINFDERYYTENETDTLLSDKTDKTYVDSELGKKQNSLGYTPVNKAGDVMGRLEVTGSTSASPGLIITGSRANLLFNTTGATGGVAFRVVQADIENTDMKRSTVASIGGYGGANLGGNPTSNYMYLDARSDGTWNKATLKVDSQDRVGIGITSSGRPTETLDVNGKIRMRTQTVSSDSGDIVATKKYVDDGLDSKVNNSRVLTDVPINAKFTDTTYSEITTAEIDAGTSSTLRTITGRRIKYILDKVQGWINSLTKSDVGLSNVDNTSDLNKPISSATQIALDNKADKSQVLTNVPINAKFTDTIYTHPSNHPYSILTGVPTKLSDFSKDINFDERYYTENETDTLLGDKTDKTYVDSELVKKQNSLGYTPVNKSGDTMTGQLRVESTTFPVIDIARNTSSTGGNLYGGARLQRKTTNPTNGVGIGFYFQAPNSNKAMTHAGMFGGALGTIQAGSEKGEIVISPSYAGQDPYTRRDLIVRAISTSKAEAELNGKLKTDQTLASDTNDTVATKKYVDNGLDNKVNNSRVLTDVPAGAKFTDTNTTYSEITTAEIDAGTASTLRTITARRIKYILDKVQGWINSLTKSDIGLGNVDNTSDLNKPISSATQTALNSKVDNSRVLTNVPTNAKFTDTNTTYSEISTAEIDAGTSSTSRVITGRRVQYILNKVASMISALTKSDIGLGNVDNTSDVNKPISTATQSALNGKVNNSQVLTNVPVGAKFTDTITTINDKTGAIGKADIVALGIPSQDTVYSHPSNHPASMITESVTRRFVSDAEKSTWNSKGIVNLGTFSSQETLIAYVLMNQIPTGQYVFLMNDYSYFMLLRDWGNYYKGVFQDNQGKFIFFQVTKTGELEELNEVDMRNIILIDNILGDINTLYSNKVDNSRVLTDVPTNAKFTDTVYTHPSNHTASMITESAAKRFVSDTEKSSWNNKAEISDIPTKVGQLQNDKNYVTQSDLGEAGLGDMTKGVYDTNNNGKVDIAEVAETVVGNEIQLGGRFKIVYNDIEDSLDFEVI